MSEMSDRYRRRADAFEALIDCTPAEAWGTVLDDREAPTDVAVYLDAALSFDLPRR